MLVVSKSFFDDAKIPQDLQQTFPALSLHEIKFLLEHFIPDKCVCCLLVIFRFRSLAETRLFAFVLSRASAPAGVHRRRASRRRSSASWTPLRRRRREAHPRSNWTRSPACLRRSLLHRRRRRLRRHPAARTNPRGEGERGSKGVAVWLWLEVSEKKSDLMSHPRMHPRFASPFGEH